MLLKIQIACRSSISNADLKNACKCVVTCQSLDETSSTAKLWTLNTFLERDLCCRHSVQSFGSRGTVFLVLPPSIPPPGFYKSREYPS